MRRESDAIALAQALIACPSVTPADAGAQDHLAGVLTAAGFKVERLTFGNGGEAVANLFATIGAGVPHLVFGGHTDVVPAGDEGRWSHPPFAGEIADGVLFGRGAVDMKGAVAAFATAAMDAAAHGGPARGTLSLLITGDEEGAAVNGTRQVLAWAKARGIRFDAALIGEPTSRRRIGDTYKTGRRGSLSATLTVTGRQGHAAYPQLADNPIPRLVRIVDRLAALRLDDGSAHFDASTLALTSVDVGNPAFNVIPAEARARFNVRFNDRWTPGTLEARLREEIAAAGQGAVDLAIAPGVSDCFLTAPGRLTTLLAAAIATVTGVTAEPSTGGGTSDARFFKDACPVVELGLIGATMHQADERVPLADLAALTAVYAEFIRLYFAPAGA